MTTQTLDDLLDEFQTCAYQSCFSLCDELRVKIKEALMSQSGGAQPEHEKYCPICQGIGQVDTGIMESPVTICNACNGTGLKANPEQEPVADSYSLADKVREALDRQSCPDAFMRIAWETIVKHYTTPPYVAKPRQRTWVGLTRKEVHDLYDSDYVAFQQRIEAKLKEKNT